MNIQHSTSNIERCGFQFVLCLFVALRSSTTLIAESPVQLTSGESFPAAAVAKIDGEVIHFTTAAGDRAVDAKDFVKWGLLRDGAQGMQVVLADGSVLVASDVRIADEMLIVETSQFGEPERFKLHGTLRLPLEVVRAVLLRVPLDPLARDRQLTEILQAAGNADLLLLTNGDLLSGTLKTLAPAASGNEQPGPLTATLETSAGEVTIAPDTSDGRLADKLTAIIFNPQLVRKPAAATPQIVVGLADGSQLIVLRVEARGEQATMVTPSATIKSHPDENIWPKITSLQVLGGRAKYLADLKAASYKHVPLVGSAWPLGVNQNGLGGKLRSGNGLYLRGIGMHATSVVAYALDGPYTKFQAELALDDNTGERGSVQFVVLADAGGSLKPIYKSPILRGGDAPLPISLDIAGAKRIALIVEPADRGDELDRANWLDARLLK